MIGASTAPGDVAEMDEDGVFATDYAAARRKFLRACEAAGLSPKSHCLTAATAPDGSALCTDVVWIGPTDAAAVLITISGTHGVEGFFGSACQVGWLRQGRQLRLPDNVAVLHVHAINPYGFAWLRRVTEDNVDLNRNFVDHAKPPVNSSYESVHSWLVPDTWSEQDAANVQTRIDGYIALRGRRAYRQAVVGGQYTRPDGLFYGGSRPTWSNHLIGRIADEFLQQAARIAVIDFHTGLGPFAYAELICRHPADSSALARARRWYGGSVSAAQAGESESPPVDGSLRMAFVDLCPRADVTAIAIEIGTVPSRQVHMALIADNWLHLKGKPKSDLWGQIKRQMREAFYPDTKDWIRPVYSRSMEILEQAIVGLSSEISGQR